MLGEYRHEAENQRELMVVAFEEVEIPNCNGGDYRDARAAAREIAEADVDAILEAGRQAAEELVKRNAHAIEALAHALLAARWCELSGEEAERVLVQSGVKRTGGVARNNATAPSPGRAKLRLRAEGWQDQASAKSRSGARGGAVPAPLRWWLPVTEA